jgi:hypothetical protein
MKLNLTKCIFGMPAGKLLRFVVSHQGIEVNPEKINAILQMKKPRCVRDVQKLAGCVAAVSRFVSRLGEKALPLYRLLRKADKFMWTEEADAAFEELKRVLSSAPVLTAPRLQELSVVSAVVAVEQPEEGKAHGVQCPVYYISEVLTDSKQRYPHYQKLAYGVFLYARRLKHYFQEHSITVVSSAPLGDIIKNHDATEQVAKWAIELAALTIVYEPRKAIKSKALADFMVDSIEAQQLEQAEESQH